MGIETIGLLSFAGFREVETLVLLSDETVTVVSMSVRHKGNKERRKLLNKMDKKLNIVVDMNGCPNRCRHCWLGHMPNRRMEDGADRFIVNYYSPYFDKFAYYSWLREPDYCDDYEERWKKDVNISKNTVPQRFELASFYRIVRDEKYVPFLKSVGVKKVQLTFFGLEPTQDRYIGRKGAFQEVMRASNILIREGVIPRWQCFINEENRDEIVQLYRMAREIRQNRCPELEFFVHEGSCDGENRKLYPIRIEKHHIPEDIKEVFLDYDALRSEAECHRALLNDHSNPVFRIENEITLNISNLFDVYYNFTHMTDPWKIGNLKTDDPEILVQNILSGNTYALNAAKQCTWAELTKKYGNPSSDRVFELDDYKMYLFNEYLSD